MDIVQKTVGAQDNETFGTMKFTEFLDHLTNC
jgi:hypothetical protein